MTLSEWLSDHWLRSGETRSTAILRLHVETGLAPMTIRRALDGKPVRARTAKTLAAATGGVVSAAALVLPPEASEAA